MIKDFKNGEEVTKVKYELMFDDGNYNGYGFPCDKDGNIFPLDNEYAKANYEYCLTHKDKFVRAGKVEKTEYTYRESNSGICNCGKRIELFNECLGGCECPYCGQWWNIWGQALKNPYEWSDGDDW